jgi:hypothetical protein
MIDHHTAHLWTTSKHTLRAVLLALCLLMLAGCGGMVAEPTTEPSPVAALPEPTTEPSATPEPTATTEPSATPEPTATTEPTATPTPEPVRFAVIGDYGWAGPEEEAVADLVKSWEPDFIVTTGDNNYPTGAASSIDDNIGQYYHEYIGNYQGSYGPGAATNRFFPTIGNHDTDTANGQPYFDYFTLPGNERYYMVDWHPVRIFAVNSVSWIEPDGSTSDSVQAEWLRDELADSPDTWNIVVFHHPPYGSGHKETSAWMDWPFQEWGAHAVLNGHNHVYERIMRNGFAYITNGIGGGPRYAWGDTIAEGSEVRFNAEHGAQLVEATTDQITFQFITVSGEVIDTYTIERVDTSAQR